MTRHVPPRAVVAAPSSARRTSTPNTPQARLIPRAVPARPSAILASEPAGRRTGLSRSSSGRPRQAQTSPKRFMKDTDCSRSVFPARRRIRQARAIGRHGLGRAAQAELPAASSAECHRGRPAVRRPARKRHLCRRGPRPITSPDHGRSTRPSTSSRPRADDAENAVRFRRGWFLGDGTGAGKGRQVAGILLDNWLKGRRRAVWVSKSDKLIEDAQRDWSALGRSGC